jgi:nitroreductase
VWSGGDGPAYAPWKDWQGNIADGLKRPLRAAILASNPHDTQPWLFQIGDNAIALFADRARNLGAFDPFRREMHLGLGAAVENLVLAARAFGFAANVTPTAGTLALSPDDTPASAAHIALAPMQAVHDALFEAIPRRHTNRGPYRADQIIAAEILRRFADLATDDTVRIVFVEDKSAALRAGRAWQRLHLAATAEGLAAQPLNQPVECIDRDAMLGRADTFASAIAKFGDAPGWEPTFVFRLGVAEHAAKPSPRRPMEELFST